MVSPSSGGEEMDSDGEKKSLSEEEKTTHEEPSSSANKQPWDGKIWSKYLSPNQ